MKKYLRSRIEKPPPSEASESHVVAPTEGTSGIIGQTQGIDTYTVESTRSLDYRYVTRLYSKTCPERQ